MEEKAISKEREIGMDLLRVFATLLILLTHFFLWNYYYKVNPQEGINMCVQTILRNISKSCVPLFIMITGYLNNRKEYDKKFLKGLLNILVIYFFFYTLNYFFIYAIDTYKGINNKLSIKRFVIDFIAFRNYFWYIGFYIGLYLITPLLNSGFENLKDNTKLKLLISLIFLGFGISFFNDIFKNIMSLPNSWSFLYAITYYLVGKYINYKKINIPKKLLIVLLILHTILNVFESSVVKIENETLPVLVQSVLIFLLLYNINIKTNFIKKIIIYLSTISLDIYLASQITDKLCYTLVFNKFDLWTKTCQQIIYYAPICLIFTFVSATILASIRKFLIRVR